MTTFFCQLGGINRTSHKTKQNTDYGDGEGEWVPEGESDLSPKLERHTHILVYTVLPSYSSSHSLHSLAFIC